MLLFLVTMESFVLLEEEQIMKVVWKCAIRTSGEQFVIVDGEEVMQELSVDSLASIFLV